MARRIPALLARPHIDLLRPARRLWKWRLESHRLQEIERHILGLHRPDDLPGGEIPALYFDVLRTGRWERMTPVLRHNADDLVGLALAAAAIARNARGDCETPAEWLALALALERHGDRAACVSWLRRVVTEAAGEPCWEEAAWRLAIHERRSGNYGRARNLWEALASRPGIRQSAALIALAKLAEWQERDPVTALRLTERILVLGAGVQAPDVRRRQQRLARKAAARPPASLPA
jgi:hypothetical protein